MVPARKDLLVARLSRSKSAGLDSETMTPLFVLAVFSYVYGLMPGATAVP